jgi:hypothetical protein
VPRKKPPTGKVGVYLLRDIAIAVLEAHLFPPVRKIVSRRGGPKKHEVTSRKNKKNMPALSRITLEGDYELGAFYWLESNSAIVWYKHQPFTIRFNDGELTISYTSDFLAKMEDGSFTLYEVKKSNSLEDKDVQARLKSIRKALSKTSVRFEVLTSDELNAQPKFDTLASLYGQTSTAITQKKVIETAKREFLLSLKYLGGSAKMKALKSVSPFVCEAGLAVAIFDGLVTSKYRLPICDGFDVSLTPAGYEEC